MAPFWAVVKEDRGGFEAGARCLVLAFPTPLDAVVMHEDGSLGHLPVAALRVEVPEDLR